MSNFKMNKKSDLFKVNMVAAYANPTLRKLKDFEQGKKYVVVKFRIARTKFGKKLTVYLQDGNQYISAFLPARMMEPFEEDLNLLSKLNEEAIKKTLFIDFSGDKYISPKISY